VKLGTASHSGSGQVVSFPRHTFSTLRITVQDTNLDRAPGRTLSAASPVGLAEVGIGGARAEDVIAMPGDLLSSAGSASQSHRLVLVMTRLRVAPVAPASDPEPVLARTFTLPAGRTFSLTGTARVSASASDSTIDALVGRSQGSNGVVAYSSGRLPGDVTATASAALDGDPTTMWSPGLGTGNQQGAWIQVNRARSTSVDHLDLVVAADGHHSVPTELRIQACDQLGADSRCPMSSPSVNVDVPPIADATRPGSTVAVPVHFAAVTGRDLTFTVTGVRLETTKDYSSQAPISLPLGIAELGIPGTHVSPPSPALSGSCRSDLVTVDGHPVSVAVTGATKAALAGNGLAVTPCGPDAGGITLGAGSHVVLAAPGATTGLDVDQLALSSAPGGGPTLAAGPGRTVLASPTPGPVPSVRVTSSTATELHVRVSDVTRPYWLVLGQSINSGWKATIDGSGQNLGAPTLIDGFSNGWLVQPTGERTVSMTLKWAPQSGENIALLVSALAVAACVALVVWPRRRRSAAVAADLDTPSVASPFAAAQAVPVVIAAMVGAIYGLAAALIVPQAGFLAIFLGVAGGVTLALAVPRTRGLLGLAVVGFATAAVLYILVRQGVERFFLGGAWPSEFETANMLVWTAIVFLGADAVVELVRRMRR
jgi:hypothetical protein